MVLDDGGNLLNTNSHNIRLALFLMDEPHVEWVMGAAERTTEVMERGIPCEDRCLGVAGWTTGPPSSSWATSSPTAASASAGYGSGKGRG